MSVGILWDLDGTLLDTLEDLTDATNYALAQFGLPPRTPEEIRSFVGNGVQMLVARAAGRIQGWEPIWEVFRDHYDGHCRIKTAPYPGILEVLQGLKGKYPMAVVSNKQDSAVKILCAAYFGDLYALGETAQCPRKPNPAMVRRAMKDLGVDRCVYVGDSEVDLRTAENAGVPCVSVTWGFRGRDFLQTQGARFFCDAPEQLPEILEKVVKIHYGQ